MADFERIISEHADADGNIPKAAISTVITAIKQAVGNEFVDKERYKAKLNEIEELKTAKQTAEDTATTAGKWETKYKELKKDYDDYKSAQKLKETRADKTDAFKQLLTACGIPEKRQAAIIKVSESEIDAIKLTADGAIEGADKLTEAVKADWGDFITTTVQHGADVQKPATAGVLGSTRSIDDIMSITDTTARRQAMAEAGFGRNPALINGKE